MLRKEHKKMNKIRDDDVEHFEMICIKIVMKIWKSKFCAELISTPMFCLDSS